MPNADRIQVYLRRADAVLWCPREPPGGRRAGRARPLAAAGPPAPGQARLPPCEGLAPPASARRRGGAERRLRPARGRAGPGGLRVAAQGDHRGGRRGHDLGGPARGRGVRRGRAGPVQRRPRRELRRRLEGGPRPGRGAGRRRRPGRPGVDAPPIGVVGASYGASPAAILISLRPRAAPQTRPVQTARTGRQASRGAGTRYHCF